MSLRSITLVCLLSCFAGAALSEPAATRVDWQQHEQRLVALEQLVHQCAADAKACSADRVGTDESITLSGNVESRIRYDWLRKSLSGMAQKKDGERSALTATLLHRLTSEGVPSVAPQNARQQANAVLQQVEFADAKPSLWQTLGKWLEIWMAKHLRFSGVDASTASWLRIVLEVILFTIPVIALGLWLMRQLREDRLIPEKSGGEKSMLPPSVSWVKEAQACADRGEWREAIHALYWQTITAFEERHIWAVTRNRTPREYLSLLDADSEKRRLLREQTLLLESIWYGRREATESDYRHAAALTDRLVRA